MSATIFKEEIPTTICTCTLNYVDDIVTAIYKDMYSTSTGQMDLPTLFLDQRSIFALCRIILYITQDLS